MPTFRRKPNRLAPISYQGFNQYFLTLCTHHRLNLFYSPRIVSPVLDSLGRTAAKFHFGVYAYCFMPDHLHLLAQAQSSNFALPSFVRAFKAASTVAARAIGEHPLWQKGYYDHVLRDSESADAVAWYIFLNPLRAGLARALKDWPFSGSLVLDWKRIEDPTTPYVPPWRMEGQTSKPKTSQPKVTSS